MVLIKEIELALKPADNEVSAQEDELIADSVLHLADDGFNNTDEYENLAPGSIRKHVEADMRVAYPGKPTSRKRIFKDNFQVDSKAMVKSDTSKQNKIRSVKGIKQYSEADLDDEDMERKPTNSFEEISESEDKEEESKFSEKTDEESLVDSNSEVISSESDGSEENYSDSNFDGSILGDEHHENFSEVEEEEVKEDHEEADAKISLFSARAHDIEADISKGRSIKNELSIWEKLIECRIKLQPGLISANKLYQKESFHEFKSSLNAEGEHLISETYSSLSNLMKGLLELQENLINAVPSFKNMKTYKRKAVDESDHKPPKKGKSDLDLLKDIHEDFKPLRNETIQKWNDKTRVSSGKINKNDFSSFDLPTLKQIEEVLLDRDRLLKRTRIKRSDYLVLGKSRNSPIEESITNENTKRKCYGDYDPEVFDDDDFYHKLLRDFIEKKTSDVTDVSKRGKQWLELQKLRSKMKAKVDTRASKGRKLRFTVHNKMVNFMAPIPSFTWTDEAKNELFKSLFC